MSRLPQDYYSAIQILDDLGDSGDVYRPTEMAAILNISYKQKNENIKKIMMPQKERDSIKRFHLNVQEIMDLLNLDTSLTILSDRGMSSVRNPNIIAIELQNRGYLWIFASHVKEAQRRLLFKQVING